MLNTGFYARRVLPWIIDLSMRSGNLAAYRQVTISAARGTVIEIGIGSGLNLPLYGSSATHLYGIDPSPQFLLMVKKRLKHASLPVELVRASAEELPIGSHCADTVVITWTLCSIRDPIKALREMRRVLKPGGRLLFVEHGLAPERKVQGWQNRLGPCWQRISGGCHLNRKMDDLIAAGGFSIDEIHTGYLKGPKFLAFIYQGSAVPRA